MMRISRMRLRGLIRKEFPQIPRDPSSVATAFVLPAALLIGGFLTLAFIVQFAGLMAERWFFFAQANHPQNLYYQAVS